VSGIDPVVISPLLACIATGIVAMLVDAFATKRAAAWLGGVGLLVAAGLGVWQSFTATERIGDLLLLGGGISAAWSIMAFTAALAIIGGIPDLSTRKGGGGMVTLMALATAAAMVLSSSVDLILTLIALETVAVAGYALVVAGRTARSVEAGMKYVIQGALATGLFMAGFAIHVGVTGGGTELRSILVGMPQNVLPTTVATVFILAAFAFKLGAVPFHSWAPDAFETAPPSAGAFMASTPKIGALLGLIVLFAAIVEPVAPKQVPTLSYVVLFSTLAVASIFVGNLAGLRQESYLRMLGYSGIAQVGYALVGVATGSGALAAVIMLISVYAVAAVGAFTFAQFVAAKRPDWDGSVAGMAGIGKQFPIAGVCLAIVMLSLTGIPLTAGFWGKLYVFTYAVGAGLEWLVLIAVLGSVVSFGYYGAVLRSAFFEDSPVESATQSAIDELASQPTAEETGADTSVAPTMLALAACALVVVIIGILPFFSGLTPFLDFFSLA